jgi:hypothetical protein
MIHLFQIWWRWEIGFSGYLVAYPVMGFFSVPAAKARKFFQGGCYEKRNLSDNYQCLGVR